MRGVKTKGELFTDHPQNKQKAQCSIISLQNSPHFQTQNLSNSIKYLQQLKSINLEWQHTSSLICFIYELLVSGLTF